MFSTCNYILQSVVVVAKLKNTNNFCDASELQCEASVLVIELRIVCDGVNTDL